MKKHILGFAIFSLIIGTAVVISRLLFSPVSETVTYVVIGESEPAQARKTSCWMRDYREFQQAGVKLEQAVIQRQTGELRTVFSLKSKNEDAAPLTVSLHFFVKNGEQSRHIATENVWVDSFSNFRQEFVNSLKWVNKLDSSDNLYVVPETSFGYTKHKNTSPIFDDSVAMPVLLSKGKGF